MEQEVKNPISNEASEKKSGGNIWLWIIGGCLGFLILIGVVIMALGWWGVNKVKKEFGNLNSEEMAAKIEEKITENMEVGNMESSIGGSMKDWITKKVGVSCEINDPENGKMTMKAKDGKVRIDGMPYSGMGTSKPGTKEENGSMVVDGDWTYIWSGAEGIKINLKEMKEVSGETNSEVQPTQEPENDFSIDGLMNKMEESNVSYNCSPANVSDADFKAPTNVNFVDFGEQLKKMFDPSLMQPGAIPSMPGMEAME